jgi:undecaprenyl-diphosphatase
VTLLEAIILGIAQGLTEFLPISSSGHLVLGEFLLKIKFDDISFEVFLHFGTFLSVVVVFRRKIWSMTRAVWLRVRSALTSDASATGAEDLHLAWMIIVGSLPAGVAGFLFKSHLEASFSSVLLVSVMLLFTGTTLFLTRFFKAGRVRLKWGDALLVGLAQALAMLPGISRSGLTISTAIFARVERSRARDLPRGCSHCICSRMSGHQVSFECNQKGKIPVFRVLLFLRGTFLSVFLQMSVAGTNVPR